MFDFLKNFCYNIYVIKKKRNKNSGCKSMVDGGIWDAEAVGSSPATPTKARDLQSLIV